MAPGKIVSKARQLRLNLQAQEGRPVTVGEAADRIGIDRKVLTRFELGQFDRIDTDTLEKICAFYRVDVGDVLAYDPDGIRTPSWGGAALTVA